MVVEAALHVGRGGEQLVQHVLVGPPAGVTAYRLDGKRAVLVVTQLAPGDADQKEALGQRAVVRQVVDRGQQLALRQVARPAEDHEARRRRGEPLQALGERVLGGDGGRHGAGPGGLAGAVGADQRTDHRLLCRDAVGRLVPDHRAAAVDDARVHLLAAARRQAVHEQRPGLARAISSGVTR